MLFQCRAARLFRLHHHLPHLLRRAHFESEALFPEVYGEEVTSRQLALLTAIDQRPGASQSQIARDIGLDLNTCSDVVIRSATKGLLQRERGVSDARSFALTLTEAGRQVVADGQAGVETYTKAVSARLSTSERDQLVDLLRKLLGFP